MGFLNWLMLGVVAYGCGVALRFYGYEQRRRALHQQAQLGWLAVFFGAACVVFTGINLWWLHKPFDALFVGFSSLVATGVFYVGMTQDAGGKMDLPD